MPDLITQEEVDAMAAGSEIRLAKGAIVTPAARDAAEARGVRIVETSEPASPATRPAAKSRLAEPTATFNPVAPGGSEQVIVTAIGRNRPGILAEITNRISEIRGNVLDIDQRILQGYFTMIMVVDIAEIQGDFAAFKSSLESSGRPEDYQVSVQHEKVFHYMHRV